MLPKGNFKRDSDNKKKIKNLYTDEQKEIIKDAIHRLNNILKKQKKQTIPFKLYEYYMDAETDVVDEESDGGDSNSIPSKLYEYYMDPETDVDDDESDGGDNA